MKAGGASTADPSIGHAVAAANPSEEPPAGPPLPGMGPCAGQMMQSDGRGAAGLHPPTGTMLSSMAHLQATPQMKMRAPMTGWPGTDTFPIGAVATSFAMTLPDGGPNQNTPINSA